MRISDWSSDVCSSDLLSPRPSAPDGCRLLRGGVDRNVRLADSVIAAHSRLLRGGVDRNNISPTMRAMRACRLLRGGVDRNSNSRPLSIAVWGRLLRGRSEEHTSELKSLMRNSYAVFCLKK